MDFPLFVRRAADPFSDIIVCHRFKAPVRLLAGAVEIRELSVTMRGAVGCIILAGLAFAASPAYADGLLDSFGRATGMIAPPIDPPDFVKNSRPSEEPAAIPVFAPPPEPNSKVKTPAELKAMDADLEGASDGREQVASKRRMEGEKRKSSARP